MLWLYQCLFMKKNIIVYRINFILVLRLARGFSVYQDFYRLHRFHVSAAEWIKTLSLSLKKWSKLGRFPLPRALVRSNLQLSYCYFLEKIITDKLMYVKTWMQFLQPLFVSELLKEALFSSAPLFSFHEFLHEMAAYWWWYTCICV